MVRRNWKTEFAAVVVTVLILMAGCSSETLAPDTQSKGEKTSSATKDNGNPTALREVTLEVTGMSWPKGWPPRVQAALVALPGVRHVNVDFANKQAVVTVEQNAYDEGKLVQALKDAGFGGSVKNNWTTGSPDDQNPPNAILPLPKADASGDDQATYSSRSFGQHLQVGAHLDRDVLRPGDAFRLAVVFEIEKNWHIYGNPVGPGIGKPTVISAQSPDGFLFDVARYAPAEKEEQDFGEAGKTWVWQYTSKTVHYLTGKVSEHVQPGNYEWTVQASAQVCDPKTCLPGKATVRISIKVVPQGTPSNSDNEELFAGFAKATIPQAEEDQ